MLRGLNQRRFAGAKRTNNNVLQKNVIYFRAFEFNGFDVGLPFGFFVFLELSSRVLKGCACSGNYFYHFHLISVFFLMF